MKNSSQLKSKEETDLFLPQSLRSPLLLSTEVNEKDSDVHLSGDCLSVVFRTATQGKIQKREQQQKAIVK